MSDTHTGMGMPIGGVIATEDVIIPNAVGSDIGCGMIFVSTNIHINEIKNIQTGNGTIIKTIIGNIMRNIPLGFKHHKTKQECSVIDKANEQFYKYEINTELIDQLESGYFQIGTLGGGNHFIELQEDEEGYLCIMVHSGSRHIGAQINRYFHKMAQELNTKWYSNIPPNYKLSFLPVDSIEGQQYITWMNLALDFAYENRLKMMKNIKDVIEKYIIKFTSIEIKYDLEINCHHNYASLENHYDKDVWIHRKGATRARKGELAVIPGAMGSYSYVVEGLGNPESFHSSSHGAGRKYSRTGAKDTFSVDIVMNDLKDQGVVLGKHNKKDVAEESRFAYKNIDEVMNNQNDLVVPLRKMKTIGVVKG